MTRPFAVADNVRAGGVGASAAGTKRATLTVIEESRKQRVKG